MSTGISILGRDARDFVPASRQRWPGTSEGCRMRVSRPSGALRRFQGRTKIAITPAQGVQAEPNLTKV